MYPWDGTAPEILCPVPGPHTILATEIKLVFFGVGGVIGAE
jgi:hypothetical protein